jgi:HD-like signal output (HDOD) protein
MNNILSIINQIQSLPTLPRVVQQVITMVDNPNVSSSDIAKTVSLDAALVSKILKVVNSAYYGLPRKISTLTQATVILGFNTIKNIVLTASVFSVFDKNENGCHFDRTKFWEHSVGCASACKVLSKRMKLGIPEEAFVVGLIHDIGKIVLDQFLHSKFIEILELVEKKNIPMRQAEREVLGVDHSQIGELLCDKWNFPKHFCEAVAYHHTPNLAMNSKKIVAIVHFANAIARLEGLGYSGDNQPPQIDPKSWEMLGIPEADLGVIIAEIKEDFEKSSVFLELLNQE